MGDGFWTDGNGFEAKGKGPTSREGAPCDSFAWCSPVHTVPSPSFGATATAAAASGGGGERMWGDEHHT